MSTETKCPFKHTASGGTSNRDWWPNQLNLKILHQHSSLSDPMDKDFNYAEAFKSLDLAAVKKDLLALIPGLDPIDPLSTRQLNRAIHAAAEEAHIDKRVSMHTLRHCFATHLLEQKEDIRVIQVLLGHKKLETTSLYTQVATDLLRQVISPLDRLPSD